MPWKLEPLSILQSCMLESHEGHNSWETLRPVPHTELCGKSTVISCCRNRRSFPQWRRIDLPLYFAVLTICFYHLSEKLWSLAETPGVLEKESRCESEEAKMCRRKKGVASRSNTAWFLESHGEVNWGGNQQEGLGWVVFLVCLFVSLKDGSQ